MKWQLDDKNKKHQIIIYILGILLTIFIIGLPVCYILYLKAHPEIIGSTLDERGIPDCNPDYMGGCN